MTKAINEAKVALDKKDAGSKDESSAESATVETPKAKGNTKRKATTAPKTATKDKKPKLEETEASAYAVDKEKAGINKNAAQGV